MTQDIPSRDFCVPQGTQVELTEWPTWIKPVYRGKDEYRERLATHVKELSGLQELLYASNRHALLLIFQAMDTAGKDGAIKHVMSGVNPQGCQVYSFKHPGQEELAHDFLWRTTRQLPERGRIGIFNRSYYEEVLIVRVHRKILEAQRLPPETLDTKSFWSDRFQSIVNQEDHLHRNGTRVVKFFLHISKEEQRQRLLKRIDDPHRNWKFSLADVHERRSWDQYMSAYEEAISATSTTACPWYIVPADDKKTARLIVSSVILGALKDLDMSYPQLSAAQRRDLKQIRRTLTSE
jgi:PPK2 family polyphosphate:nucleotide phosphotransferase